MTPPGAFDWEAEGRRIGDTFDALHSLVVLGTDPRETALVALGIARAQSARRRVALGDLIGGADPIEHLVEREDPHGLVDSFTFGVSLNRIALPVPGEGDLFVLPSGTETPDYEDLLPNPRWRRLASGFREVDALLVLAAPATAPEIEALVAQTDGAVLVGNAAPRTLHLAQVLAAVREPAAEAPVRAPVPATGASAGAARPGSPRSEGGRRRMAIAIGAVLTAVLAGIGLWLAYRPLASTSAVHPAAPHTTRTPVALTAPDSVVRPDSGPTAGMLAVPVLSDPHDSAAALSYAVALTNTNTEAGAILNLRQNGGMLPAATYAPVPIDGVQWFRVLAGAYRASASADSLLADLRGRGLLDAHSGSVVRTPFAFVVDSSVPASAVPQRLAQYAVQGRPVYALRQIDGSARLYAGAFETPAQAALYAESLRAAGIAPVLAFRIGRVF